MVFKTVFLWEMAYHVIISVTLPNPYISNLVVPFPQLVSDFICSYLLMIMLNHKF